MLADPFGDRMIPGPSIREEKGRVSYLVEVCDPPESEEFAYTVNDLLVSDLITPSFFDPVGVEGVRYSFTGAVKQPRQVLVGGYVSWRNQTNEHIEQLVVTNGEQEFRDLGVSHPSSRSVREFVDGKTEHPQLDQGLRPQNKHLRSAVEAEQKNKQAREQAAKLLRQELQAIETLLWQRFGTPAGTGLSARRLQAACQPVGMRPDPAAQRVPLRGKPHA